MSTPATIHGLPASLITWNPDFKATRDDKNLWTGSCTFTCRRANLTNLIPAIGSPCQEPGFTFMFLKTVDVANNEGDTATVTCNYSGTSTPEFSFDRNNVPYTSSMSISTTEEPIETLKKYRTQLTQEDKNTVAEFKAGRYKIKKVVDGEITELISRTADNSAKIVYLTDPLLKELINKINSGIVAYLVPKPIYRYSYTSKKKPSGNLLNDVGKIKTPPKAPDVSGGRNWLVMSINYDYSSNLYNISEEYMLSEEGGWDTDIYENE